jgi:hypothetical protein
VGGTTLAETSIPDSSQTTPVLSPVCSVGKGELIRQAGLQLMELLMQAEVRELGL